MHTPYVANENISLRARSACLLGRVVSWASRSLGRGSGMVIGGRVALRLAPDALAQTAASRRLTLVSGTNGKTTTTALLRAARSTQGVVASNVSGANMPAGLLASLLREARAPEAVLEVDEAYLPAILAQARAEHVVLLNLSRDQLDRHHEVRHLAEAWRRGLRDHPPVQVIANADDPLIVWAAHQAPRVTWVGAGAAWTQDAALCPRCSTALSYPSRGWVCPSCGLQRPDCAWTLCDPCAVAADGREVRWDLVIPGHANRSNATMALVSALAGVEDWTDTTNASAAMVAAMSRVSDIGGRYATITVAGRRVRLLLAKNPAGWAEALRLLDPGGLPVVLEVNDNLADGRDPSWLWDVDFTVLRGRPVWVCGTRADDLAVRLLHDDVDHHLQTRGIDAIAAIPGNQVEYIGTYTAFQDLRRHGGRPPSPGRSGRARLATRVRRPIRGSVLPAVPLGPS